MSITTGSRQNTNVADSTTFDTITVPAVGKYRFETRVVFWNIAGSIVEGEYGAYCLYYDGTTITMTQLVGTAGVQYADAGSGVLNVTNYVGHTCDITFYYSFYPI